VRDYSRALDNLHDEVEEWGTITLSSFLLAPPDKVERQVLTPVKRTIEGTPKVVEERVEITKLTQPMFNFGLEKTAADYFNLANQGEGTGQTALRIFQQFSASGQGQFFPDEAAKFGQQRELNERNLEVFNELEGDKLDAYRANLQRQGQLRQFNEEQARRNVASAEERVNVARVRSEQADRRAETTQKELEDATARKTEADRELKKVQDEIQHAVDLATTPEAKQNAQREGLPQLQRAQNAVRDAQYAVDDAAQPSAAAEKEKADAAKELAESSAARNTAESELAKVITAADAPPSATPIVVTPTGGQPAGSIPLDYPGIFGPSTVSPVPGDAAAASKAFSNFVPPPPVAADFLPDFGSGSLKKPLATAEPNNPENSVANFPARARLLDASSNKAIQEIFNFLGNPGGAEPFLDKTVIFGVANVGVNPGWRTKEGYTAQLDIKASYEWADAHSETIRRLVKSTAYPVGIRKRIAEEYAAMLTEQERDAVAGLPGTVARRRADFAGYAFHKMPAIETDDLLVTAVSPLMDQQALDLTSSYARQDDIAIFLSAALARAGFRGQADAYARFIKQRRHDVATRSAMAIANSYSAGGGVFGFQIGPRLRALAEPENRKSKPAQTLDRQSFPVLVLFGVASDDLRPILVNTGGTITVYERRMVTRYSHRWQRTDRHRWLVWLNDPKKKPSDLLHRHATLTDLFKLNKARKARWSRAQAEASSSLMSKGDEIYEVFDRAVFGAVTKQRVPAFFLVPPYLIPPPVVPVAIETPVLDFLPMVTSFGGLPPATGDGMAATPLKIKGKIEPGKQNPVFSVLVQGKRFERVDVSRLSKVSDTAMLFGEVQRFSDTSLVVSFQALAPKGSIALLLPLIDDPKRPEIVKQFPQVVSRNFEYVLTE
jgi:hypothetical protein